MGEFFERVIIDVLVWATSALLCRALPGAVLAMVGDVLRWLAAKRVPVGDNGVPLRSELNVRDVTLNVIGNVTVNVRNAPVDPSGGGQAG